METFGAYAYTDSAGDPRWHLKNVPDTYALRLDLDYLDGRKTVLIYDKMPSAREQQDLMWKVQSAAGKHGFRVTRTEADGTSIEAPAIGGKG